MARKQGSQVLNAVVWLTGILVSLAVGFGMIGPDPTLTVKWIPVIVTQLAGWVVIITTAVSAVLAVLQK